VPYNLHQPDDLHCDVFAVRRHAGSENIRRPTEEYAMAAGRPDAPDFSFRKFFLWTEIFRTFQVALDPKKLVVAAAGILAMSLGWFVLSHVFHTSRPDRNDESVYGAKVVQDAVGPTRSDGVEYTAAEIVLEGDRRFLKDMEAWKVLDGMAGPNGRLRTLPWYEYRGPNPYLLITAVAGGNAVEIKEVAGDFLVGTTPVLVEPLFKLLLPIVKIVDPDASTMTRLYLFLCLLWGIVVWAFFGGIITRLAAVQFTGKERTTLKGAVQFVVDRYVHYILSPLAPIGIILAVILVMMVVGFVALIPFVGDVLIYGLGLPLLILGGLAIAMVLVGLIGYPMMYPTLSTEGTDTFDSFSRTFSYVFQAPWSYLWYWMVAIAYGAVVTMFVLFIGSLAVYMAKWSVSQAPLSDYTNRKPDYLFQYTPETFGWKELMLKGGPLELRETSRKDEFTGRTVRTYEYANKPIAENYNRGTYVYGRIGAGMASFWMVLLLLAMIGFSYSYFWSASTMIYLLMRKKVDETEMDELYVEEKAFTPPIVPPAAPSATTNMTGLPLVPPAPMPAASMPVAPPTPIPLSSMPLSSMPPADVPTSMPLSSMPPADVPTSMPPAEMPNKPDEPKAE